MLDRTQTRDAAPPLPDVAPVSLPVPEGFLRIPPACDWPRILRFESGLALDPHLRRLARLSGAIDRGLARRLLHLRRSGGYVRLGKACFGDYARERVGVAERTAQEWVRLGRGLERLPLLDRAMQEGRLTWTAAAQIARIATSEDQEDWIRLAERTPVRELKQRIKKALQERKTCGADSSSASSDDATPAPPGTSQAPEADGTDEASTGLFDLEADDRPVKLHLFASKRTAHLWESVLELCELVAGSPLAPSEAPEYVLADFLSGTEPAASNVRAFPTHPPRKHGYGGKPARGSQRDRDRSALTVPVQYREVDFASDELSPSVRRVLQLIEADLPPGDAVALDAQIHALMAARHGLDLDLARLLRLFQSLGLARHLRFESFTAYVEERLNISADRARALVRLDRSLSELRETREAVRDGRVGTVAAALIARVATPGRIESAWLQRARQVSVVRLRKEVRWAERRNAQGSFRSALPPSTGPLPSPLQTLTMALLANEGTKLHPFEGSGAWIRQETPPAADPGRNLADRETFAHPDSTADRETSAHADSTADRETFAHACSTAERNRGDGFTGHVDGDAMAEAIRLYREFIASDEGPDGHCPVEFWIRRSALDLWTDARHRIAAVAGRSWISDAEVLHEIALAFLFTHLRPWLEAVQTGDPTAVRDRFVCQVPGCTMRSGAGHHLRFRSDLGPDELWNLLFICAKHHLIGIHAGPYIRVTGRAPDALKAELGLLPGGAALETWVRGVPPAPTRACA